MLPAGMVKLWVPRAVTTWAKNEDRSRSRKGFCASFHLCWCFVLRLQRKDSRKRSVDGASEEKWKGRGGGGSVVVEEGAG